jgi:hypothetical protein
VQGQALTGKDRVLYLSGFWFSFCSLEFLNGDRGRGREGGGGKGRISAGSRLEREWMSERARPGPAIVVVGRVR